MSFNKKRLYELLPALYRIRDTEVARRMQEAGIAVEGLDPNLEGPLAALLEIIAAEIAGLEENIEQLYDDQFIETCAEWVIPYIGELVGARNLIEIPDTGFSQRSEVANTIRYRRRKGTASVIEQLARDVTGWDANVVEFFQRLATTQHLNHLRPQNLAVSGLKDWRLLEFVNTPFDQMPKTADVRRIENQRGKYNIHNVGIFLWRIRNYSLRLTPPFQVDVDRFTFNVLGKNTLLYQRPAAESDISQLAAPLNVPMPISRRRLWEDLDTYYGNDKSFVLLVNGKPITPETFNLYFNPFPSPPVTSISEVISACNLSDLYNGFGTLIGWANMPLEKIAIDPVLGRIAFPAAMLPALAGLDFRVMYHYGFSASMGGGEYERETSFSTNQDKVISVPNDFPAIQPALNHLAGTSGSGIIEITDNEVRIENLIIAPNDGVTIEIRAANGKRPTLELTDYVQISAGENSHVSLNGLLINGRGIRIDAASRLTTLKIQHCTLVPVAATAMSSPPAASEGTRIIVDSIFTEVILEKSICGAMEITDGARVRINDCIIDAGDPSAIAYAGSGGTGPGGPMTITNSTVIGGVQVVIMTEASNTIFLADEGMVWAKQLQDGCVRFSYFPPGSKLPRAYRCQPEFSGEPKRVKPTFTSLIYGDPGYAQLSKSCVQEISQGADDEAEMGVFHHLYQPQKLSNLRTRLHEYLRFGLEAGIFYAS